MEIQQLFTQPAAPAPIDPSTATATSEPKRRHLGRRIVVTVLVIIILLAGTIAVTEAGWLKTGIDRVYGKSTLALLWGGMPADSSTALHSLVAYASKISLPDQFSVKNELSADTTIHMASLTGLFGDFNATEAQSNPAVTDGTSFYQMLNTATNELPTQTDISQTTSSAAPALDTLSTPTPTQTDITAKGKLRVDGTVVQSKKQFSVNFDFSAESSIPNWKSLAAKTTVTRDADTLYVQVPDLSSWPLPETTVSPYRAFYGKYVKIPIPADVQAEVDKYFSQYAKPLDQLTKQNILSQDQIDKITESIATRLRRVGIERVDGHATSHWQFALNKDSLVAMTEEVTTILSTGTPADSPLSKTNFYDITSQTTLMKQWLPEFTYTVDFWIRRGDYVMVKSAEQFAIDSAYIKATLGNNTSLTDIPTKQTVTVNLPNPADTVTMDELTAAFNKAPTPAHDLSNAYERDQQRVADLATIKNKLDAYSQTTQIYPISPEISRLDDPTAVATIALSGTSPDIVTYKDPLPQQYYYGYTSDGTTYTLSAVIEDTAQTACTISGPICLYKVTN